jgi:hypothetical protein
MVYEVEQHKHLPHHWGSTTLYMRRPCSNRQVAQLQAVPNQVNQPAGHITKIISAALSNIIKNNTLK